MAALVHPARRDGDGPDELRARALQLEAMLEARAAEITAMRAALGAFEQRYRQEVGLLHEQLDELDIAIAEAERGEAPQPATRDTSGPPPPPAQRPAPQPRYTSDAVRKLFRDVARIIHPDLARDEATRDHRHRLMVEANRAYVMGDEAHLRWILQVWERGPDALAGSDPEAERLHLERRVAHLEEQLGLLASDLAALQASPMWSLKVMVDQAAARGKDLVRDMVDRLKRDIMVATNRLEAMRGSHL